MLLDEEIEKKKNQTKEIWYILVKGALYIRAPGGSPLRLCISLEKRAFIVEGAHIGIGYAHQVGLALKYNSMVRIFLANTQRGGTTNFPHMP